jgi:hypothetical protein
VIVEKKIETCIESYRIIAIELSDENIRLKEKIRHNEALLKDIKETYCI